MRNVLQAAGTDAIDSFFIFLHLLKRQAEGIPELLLTHSQHHAAHSHAIAHVFVDGICCFLGHRHAANVRFHTISTNQPVP